MCVFSNDLLHTGVWPLDANQIQKSNMVDTYHIPEFIAQLLLTRRLCGILWNFYETAKSGVEPEQICLTACI